MRAPLLVLVLAASIVAAWPGAVVEAVPVLVRGGIQVPAYANVVLTGGNAKIPGMRDRMCAALLLL